MKHPEIRYYLKRDEELFLLQPEAGKTIPVFNVSVSL